MSDTLAAALISSVLVTLSAFAFWILIDVWDDQSTDISTALVVSRDRLDSHVAISSAEATDQGCGTFAISVHNPGGTSVSDFSNMDVVADYADASGAKILKHLAYGSDWSIGSISPDTQDPNIWDPGETATLSFTLNPVLQRDRTGVISIGTPGGIADMAYLECHQNYFFHYETSAVATSTYYQLQKNVEADGSGTTTIASFSAGQVGRVRPSRNDGRLVYPLTGLSSLGSTDWTVTYRVRRDDPATSTLSGTKIAFTSDRDGNSEIYVIDQDGGNVTNLSNNVASDDRPSWSPDGLRLAFASNRDGNWEIYVMDADGANQTNLTSNGADDRYPAWSPDGSKIAFYSYRDGNWEVYSMNADGSSPSNLTNNSANDSYPAWSPNGSKIAFHTDRDGNFEVYVMDANGSGQTNLTNNVAEDGAPAWSPATSTIAFRSARDGNQEIYLMNADGSSQTRLTSNSATDVDPSWSPDGTKLAFASDRVGNYDVYTMNADGSNQASLAPNAAIDSEAEWSPFLPSSHGFVWFTTARDISLAATGAWHDIDLASHVPSGATGAIVELVNTAATDYNGMVRGKQDTRDYISSAAYGEIEAETHRWQVVKVDRNRLIEGYISSTFVDFKLLGYTVGSDPVYFDVPPDITPATTGAWATVDVSAYVDASTDGVVLLIDSTASADRDYAVREVGSGDSTTSLELEEYGNTMQVAGIDASDQFQVYVEDSSVKVYLVGRTKGSVVYYSDDVAITDPATGSWQELDADGSSVPTGANGMILEIANTSASTGYKLGTRHGESTHDWNGDIGDGTHLQGVAGLDDGNKWEQYMQDTALDVSIAAYTRLTPADIHADIDVLVRKADGTVRGIIAKDVADSRSIPETAWQTVSAVYYLPGYTIVDDTDYLEIDLFADSTNNTATSTVALSFNLDDSSLAVADQGRIRADIPASIAPPTYASGKYTGDGSDDRSITGVGFQPDVVIIKADDNKLAVIRTSSMAGDSAKPIKNQALASNLIQALDSDGFTLGTDAKVNSSGVTYYWSAFMAKPGEIKVGYYSGIGSAQSIDGVGFAPEAIMVIPATNDETNLTTTAMPAGLSIQLDTETGNVDRITSIDADGFSVGTGPPANKDLDMYHYIAWNSVAGKMAVGLYSGDDSDDRSITGVGFEPEFVIVKADSNVTSVQRPNSIDAGADQSLNFLNQASFANGIQGLEPDGFEVGSDTTVNAASTNYYWLAFRPRP